MDDNMSSFLAGQNSMANHPAYAYNDGFGMGGGSAFIWIILIFAVFMGGGGGFGWGGNSAALQGALTRGDMYEGFNASNSFRNQNDLIYGQFDMQKEIMNNRFELAQGNNATQREIMQNRYDNQLAECATQRGLLENRYTSQVNTCGIQRDAMENRYQNQLAIQAVQAQLAQQVDDLKTATHAEAEATRDLINANLMQELREKLQRSQAERDNLEQTTHIINTLLPVSRPAYITASPYYSYYPTTGSGTTTGGSTTT